MSDTAQEVKVLDQERKITLWVTKLGKKSILFSKAMTWGDLKKEIKKESDINIDSLLATENVTRRDLANELGVLPEGDFVIYLRQKEVKSGVLPYREVRAAIQKAIADGGSDVAIFFNQGKNYTTKTGTELNELWDKWTGGGKDAVQSSASTSAATPVAKAEKPKTKPEQKSVAPVAEEAISNVADVVQAVAESKTVEADSTELEDAQKALELLKGIFGRTENAGVKESLSEVFEVLEEDIIPALTPAEEESEEDRIAREAREAEEAEEEAIRAEAELLKGKY